MKKMIALLCAAVLTMLLCSCKAANGTDVTTPTDADTTVSPAGEQTEQMRLLIVDGAETGTLVLAGENQGDVYTASKDELTVYLDDQPADASALEDGMYVLLDGSYELLETWPAQFAGATVHAYSRGTEQNPAGMGYDLCGLWLQVLEDLWDADAGLNDGAELISVDLSKAPGELTAGEKSAIAWIFASKHNAQPLTLTMDELQQNGYLATDDDVTQNEGNPVWSYWKNGLLFSITTPDGADTDSKKEIEFNAMKWRSPLGAIFNENCTAKWNKNGTWEPYSVGSFAIA